MEERQSTYWRSNASDGVQLCVVLLLLLLLMTLAACKTTDPTAPRPSPEQEPPRGPVTRTVDGFRIQIGMWTERTDADAAVVEAVDWFRDLAAGNRPRYMSDGNGDLDVEVAWRAPYYRVRIGRFATRQEANQALSAVSRRFPEAFAVPSTVTVTR